MFIHKLLLRLFQVVEKLWETLTNNLKIDFLFILISCITLYSFLIFTFLFKCSHISEALQKVKYETNTTAVQNSLAGILRIFFVVSKIHLSQSTFLISKPDFTK